MRRLVKLATVLAGGCALGPAAMGIPPRRAIASLSAASCCK